jgi:hypothetical protein
MAVEYGLGNNRFLTATHFNGDRIVHLREYEEKNGKKYATRKGVSFDKSRFASFVSKLDAIDEARKFVDENVKMLKIVHIGGNLYATVKSDVRCIDLRYFFFNTDRVIPTRRGIGIRRGEWELVKQYAKEMKEKIPDLKSAQPCHLDHKKAESCNGCNPFSSAVQLLTHTVESKTDIPAVQAVKRPRGRTSLIDQKRPRTLRVVLPMQQNEEANHGL